MYHQQAMYQSTSSGQCVRLPVVGNASESTSSGQCITVPVVGNASDSTSNGHCIKGSTSSGQCITVLVVGNASDSTSSGQCIRQYQQWAMHQTVPVMGNGVKGIRELEVGGSKIVPQASSMFHILCLLYWLSCSRIEGRRANIITLLTGGGYHMVVPCIHIGSERLMHILPLTIIYCWM